MSISFSNLCQKIHSLTDIILFEQVGANAKNTFDFAERKFVLFERIYFVFAYVIL